MVARERKRVRRSTTASAHSAAAGAHANTIGGLLDVRRARFVVIHDSWVGYSHHSPVAASYELKRSRRGGLVGSGSLSTSVVGERLVDVRIAAGIAVQFLEMVADARVQVGPYQPFQDHTDDYPHIELALHVGVTMVGSPSGIALLYTESQGTFHAPWGLFVGGQMFVVPGDTVGEALALLKVPLKRARLDQMMGADGSETAE